MAGAKGIQGGPHHWSALVVEVIGVQLKGVDLCCRSWWVGNLQERKKAWVEIEIRELAPADDAEEHCCRFGP